MERITQPSERPGGGEGPAETLALNKFTADGARAVAEKAKAAGLGAAVVGVVDSGRRLRTALIVINAADGNVRHLPMLEFDADLLNLAIESLKGLTGIEKAIGGGQFGPVDDEPLIEGVKGAAELKVTETTIRYDV